MRLVEIWAGFGFEGIEEGLHDVKAGYGEGPGCVEFELIGEGGELFFEGAEGFGEGAEAGVAAEFGEGAGDADGA